ncbi:MAG: 5'/3'-nucleotidase SurE [Bradymonadaceae bacterium]
MSEPTLLVTNDDGAWADGLRALAEAARELGNVWVFAPDSEQSGVGHALSLRHPLRVRELDDQFYSVSGSPADCVYVALNHFLDEPPALCLSGVNHGANLADDLLYSGTVAGAVEATLCEVSSIAVSLASVEDETFDVAADFALSVAREVLDRRLPRDSFLNINVPGGADQDTEAVVAKLGRRNYRRGVERKDDPRGRPYYWLGGRELGFDDLPGSDCNAVTDNKITVTPVKLDLTDYEFLSELNEWNVRGWHDDG